MKVDIVMQIKCGATVIINGKRYKVTAVGVRGCEGTKWHSRTERDSRRCATWNVVVRTEFNSPIEYYIESNGKELIAVLKQKERL